jgi:hypothetical protein
LVHSNLCNEGDQLSQLLALDAVAICDRLAVIVTDPIKYRIFLLQRGTNAQSLLNLIQEVCRLFLVCIIIHSISASQQLLDCPHIDIALRSPFVNALLRLSSASGLYPECLLLKGMQRSGIDPVASGRFGDVWQGLVQGERIAIKVLRLYVTSDVKKHLKVWLA